MPRCDPCHTRRAPTAASAKDRATQRRLSTKTLPHPPPPLPSHGDATPTYAARAAFRSALTIAATRMREDTVFRDAVHHFLRAFDRALADFAAGAADAELAALSDTRSGRAFALMGRVAGLFD